MKKVLAFLVLLGLSGCFDDPKLKTDSEESFNSSYAEIVKNMKPEEQKAFDDALRDIVYVQIGMYGPEREAKVYHMPMDSGSDNVFDTMQSNILQGMSSAVGNIIDATWDKGDRAKAVIEQARTIVGGHTAKEIIAIAASERQEARKKAIEIYKTQLDQAKAALKKTEDEVTAEAKKRGEDEAMLAAVEITNARFAYIVQGFLTEPEVSFTITNKGTIPIKRIYVDGNLQTPGRAVPWLHDDFNYTLSGGLEPGETQNLRLAPNIFSSWGKVPKEAASDGVLTLKLIAFEDASGKRIGANPGADDELNKRKEALEKGVADLQQKIDTLTKDSSSGT